MNDEQVYKAATRLWAAVVELAVDDYRRAVMDGDEAEARHIEKQMEVMGYGAYCPPIRERAEIFRDFCDRETKDLKRGRRRYCDCPACHGQRTVCLSYNKLTISCSCSSCGLRYVIPIFHKEEDEDA